MECFYINLDSDTRRRSLVEDSFARNRADGWSLTRFAAVDGGDISVQGTLRPAEKGCFLSHKRLIADSIGRDGHILVVEDDAVFGARTFATIDRYLALIAEMSFQWDLLFTDVAIGHLPTMIDLFKLRRQLSESGEIRLLDLAEMNFCGTTAYVVNAASKSKIVGYLDVIASIDAPYDLYLRKLIYDRKLRACLFFPFITSLSDSSDSSQIQPSEEQGTDIVWNTFRKLMWSDRNVGALKETVAAIGRTLCDDDAAMFATLVAAMLSESYQAKDVAVHRQPV